jgi:SpoVK/Ycf46/Vps4 family AAA+-type ATPase
VQLFSQLLIEMDAVKAGGDVVVIGATNRPDLLDPSLLRPGRLERSIFVGLPDETSRAHQLHSILPTLKCDEETMDSIISFVSHKTHGFTCADVVQLCNEAGIEALARKGQSIEKDDFASVLEWRQPSVSSTTLKQLQHWSLA